MQLDEPPAPDARVQPMLAWLRDYAARRINSQLIDERRTIPPSIVLDFGNRGLLGMQIPKLHGGLLEFTHFEALRVQRQLGAIDLTLAFFVGLNNGLGVRPLLRFAQPLMKERYLPDLARGRILGAFAITESGAGSNPLALAASAQRCDGGFRLSGTKLWCGSAGWAGVISVYARHLDAQGRAVGHVGLCIDADQHGLRIGKEAMTMGLRGMVQNALHFDDALVGADRVLGSQFGGLSVASDVMLFGRLGIAATAIGGLWRALQLMLRYSRERHINTGVLYEHGHARAVLNDTWRAATVLGQLVDDMAHALDQNQCLPAELYAAVKLLASEALWAGADSAVQMLGGRGYCENNGAAQLLRDARITRLFEGPSETLASYIGERQWRGKSAVMSAYFLQHGEAGRHAQAELQQLLEQVRMRFPDANAAREHAVTALGYACAWQMVAAGNKRRVPLESAWLDQQYQRAADRALASVPNAGLPTAAHLQAEIAHLIGDIQQSAAGADFMLDEYLRK